MGLPWFAPKTAGSQAGPTTMTVSSPGAPRWRHISQSGSNTEVFDYRCRELSKLTKEVTPMDRQFDPMQMESNPPVTQGLQHIPTEPPAWAKTAGRVIHYLMNDFGGGRRVVEAGLGDQFPETCYNSASCHLHLSSTTTSALQPGFIPQCRESLARRIET